MSGRLSRCFGPALLPAWADLLLVEPSDCLLLFDGLPGRKMLVCCGPGGVATTEGAIAG